MTDAVARQTDRSFDAFSFLARFAPLIFLLLLMTIFAIMEPRFLSSVNLFNVMRQVSIVGLLAISPGTNNRDPVVAFHLLDDRRKIHERSGIDQLCIFRCVERASSVGGRHHQRLSRNNGRRVVAGRIAKIKPRNRFTKSFTAKQPS